MRGFRDRSARAAIAGLVLVLGGLTGCVSPVASTTPVPSQTPGLVVLTIDGRVIKGSWSMGCVKLRDHRRILMSTKDTKGTYQNANLEVDLTPDGQAVTSLVATFTYANSVTRTLKHTAKGSGDAGTSAKLKVDDLTYEISGTGRLTASATAEAKLVPYRFTTTCPEWQDFD